MEHHEGPRRRQVGADNPDGLIFVPIRLRRDVKPLIARLRQPGVLADEGCSHGDVLVIAVRDMARRWLGNGD